MQCQSGLWHVNLTCELSEKSVTILLNPNNRSALLYLEVVVRTYVYLDTCASRQFPRKGAGRAAFDKLWWQQTQEELVREAIHGPDDEEVRLHVSRMDSYFEETVKCKCISYMIAMSMSLKSSGHHIPLPHMWFKFLAFGLFSHTSFTWRICWRSCF